MHSERFSPRHQSHLLTLHCQYLIEQDNQEIAEIEKEIAEQLVLLGVKM